MCIVSIYLLLACLISVSYCSDNKSTSGSSLAINAQRLSSEPDSKFAVLPEPSVFILPERESTESIIRDSKPVLNNNYGYDYRFNLMLGTSGASAGGDKHSIVH